MAAVTRRQYKGASAQTTITNALASGDTTITIAANTGWPSTAAVPFFVVISPGTSSEEKCLATISGTTLTLTRAQDDTTATSHSSGATIYPVFTADDADDANFLASRYTTKGDLVAFNGTDAARLAVGTNDHVLTADSTQSTGLKWAATSVADGAITTAKLADGAVTTAKLGSLTVNDQVASYTLVVGDVNKRVMMNSSSSTTITVNNSIFSAGNVVYLANKGSGTSTITAGAGVTINVSGSLALSQYGGGTLLALSASTFVFFPAGGVGAANFSDTATGTYSSGGFNFKFKTFLASGTLTVTQAGLADLLIVGGGGGGTMGGGGAGGYLTVTEAYLPAGTLTVTVGAGGASSLSGSNGQAYNGIASRIGSYYAVGGGGGGGMDSGSAKASPGNNGGSGGGTGGSTTVTAGGAGTAGQGNNGGSNGGLSDRGGGGGGGASANGSNGSGNNGGAGGAGTSSSITDTPTTRAGGGGGYADGGSAGSGGAGGGGNGGNGSAGTAGTANTGGGGGSYSAGGSGVVIVRVKV
jgi:hypothetical protein